MDERAFRDALGCYATGIAVVTTAGEGSSPVGVTVNSFASVSLDPPLVLFSLGHGSTSLEAMRGGGRFVINVLGAHQRALSARFAQVGEDRWEDVEHTLAPCGSPILSGCLAHFVCRTERIMPGGDHDIFLGRVESFEGTGDGAPLLYFRGGYRVLEDGERG